jgi:hypothetical protein
MWRIYLTSSLKNITNFKHTLTPHLCPPLESTQHIAWDESSELPTTTQLVEVNGVIKINTCISMN